MPEFHSEPYVYLAGLSHKSAILAWGAFYFKAKSQGEMKLVDDDDLQWIHPPRRETIGARSQPYGPVEIVVRDDQGTIVSTSKTHLANHSVVAGLQPNTRYRYTVKVKDHEWAEGVRWDWVPEAKGLKQAGRSYTNEFVTLPDPTQPLPGPFSFVVLGDFGTGVRKPSSDDEKRQREVAAALERVVDAHGVRLILTTGDNIYAKRRFLLFTSSEGDEDDDWFFTYYQPYRYVLNRVPVYPSIGNHDTAESEENDDREQLMDNLYLGERLAGEEVAGRASLGPGLFYKFRVASDVEFVCLDTSKETLFTERLFKHPKHELFLRNAFPAGGDGVRWRVPFCHHPPFSAGPRHHNTAGMERLVSMFEAGGVRACFSGHEHNFQHSQHNRVDYFVTGAGSKIRSGQPNRLAEAHTRSWAAKCHFLLVTIDGSRMIVRAIGEDPAGGIRDIQRNVVPEGIEATEIVVTAS